MIKFQKTFDKHWCVFPACITLDTKLIEYYPPAKRLSLHFLWWHCAWTFLTPRKEKNNMKLRYTCRYCGLETTITSFWRWFLTPHLGAKKLLRCKHHACSYNDAHFMERVDGRKWLDWPKEKKNKTED